PARTSTCSRARKTCTRRSTRSSTSSTARCSGTRNGSARAIRRASSGFLRPDPGPSRERRMNRFGRLLPQAHVALDLDVSSKKRLFEQIGLLFENSRQIPRARVFDSLFDREKLGSTGLGYGVAIPHGRIKTIKEPVFAFVRSAQPVAFEAPDGEPVRLVFAMLFPGHATAAP